MNRRSETASTDAEAPDPTSTEPIRTEPIADSPAAVSALTGSARTGFAERVLDGVGTLIRFGLAAVWLISGGVKAADPNQTYLAVKAYDVLPTNLIGPIADGLPFLEFALGLLVLVGIGTRFVAVLSVVVLAAFIAGVSQAWARGLSIDCGCFGGGGAVDAGDTQYGRELLRDLGFMALAAWLLVRPASRWSLDRGLIGARPVTGQE